MDCIPQEAFQPQPGMRKQPKKFCNTAAPWRCTQTSCVTAGGAGTTSLVLAALTPLSPWAQHPLVLQPAWKITEGPDSPEHSPAGTGVMLWQPSAALGLGLPWVETERWAVAHGSSWSYESWKTVTALAFLLVSHRHLPAQDRGCVNDVLQKCML